MNEYAYTLYNGENKDYLVFATGNREEAYKYFLSQENCYLSVWNNKRIVMTFQKYFEDIKLHVYHTEHNKEIIAFSYLEERIKNKN